MPALNLIDTWSATGVISPTQAACLVGQGVNGAIISASSVAVSQQQALAAAGATCFSVYGRLFWGTAKDWSYEVSIAQQMGLPAGSIIWIDCEWNVDSSSTTNAVDGTTLSDRINTVQAAGNVIAAAGFQPGIYSSAAFWVPWMGNTTQFSSWPLWLADWTSTAVTTVNFGGWTQVAVQQFASGSGGMPCGLPSEGDLDSNYTLCQGAPPPPGGGCPLGACSQGGAIQCSADTSGYYLCDGSC